MFSAEVAKFAAATQCQEIGILQRESGLPAHYLDDLTQHVAPLADALYRHQRTAARPVLVGLNGSQGSGKSTLAQFLAKMLHLGAGLQCAVVSIDDFYLEKSARQRLSRDVHPLLLTRGVPGTHDVELANTTLDALLDPERMTPVPVPAFDKATDDRVPPAAWPEVSPDIDLVILEGWCVACTADDPANLEAPVNRLERTEDADGVWRRYVNDRLNTDYRQLFARLDLLVMLAAPSFDCVYEWREQQEKQLAQTVAAREDSGAANALLFGASLRRFIEHFERLTRHQLHTLPARADAVIKLAIDHRMVAHVGPLFS